MERKEVFTKILAIVGTILAALPILAPIFFSIVSLVSDGVFRFDYLMPAELLPFALVGGGLLVWTALRAHAHLKLVGWSLGVAIISLAGAQGTAVVTGLASGETDVGGWQWVLVLVLLAIYTLALVAVTIGGALLLRDLFNNHAGSLAH